MLSLYTLTSLGDLFQSGNFPLSGIALTYFQTVFRALRFLKLLIHIDPSFTILLSK